MLKINETEHTSNDSLEVDPLLEILVTQANLYGTRLGITLTVNGIQITGLLVGVREFYKEYANAVGGVFGEEFKNQYSAIGDRSYENLVEDQKRADANGVSPPGPNFIHLVDAKFFASTVLVPTMQGLIWRGKLAHISGYSVGSLSAGE